MTNLIIQSSFSHLQPLLARYVTLCVVVESIYSALNASNLVKACHYYEEGLGDRGVMEEVRKGEGVALVKKAVVIFALRTDSTYSTVFTFFMVSQKGTYASLVARIPICLNLEGVTTLLLLKSPKCSTATLMMVPLS